MVWFPNGTGEADRDALKDSDLPSLLGGGGGPIDMIAFVVSRPRGCCVCCVAL